MRHLLYIQEIQHLDRHGNVIWQAQNLPNTFHADGEFYLLDIAFRGETDIPDDYYFGLDNRTTIAEEDTMLALVDEPESGYHGYARQAVASEGQFTLMIVDGHWVANSPIILFSASGGSYGPVKNLFMCTTDAGELSSSLVSSVPLNQTITLSDGESISVRMGLSLKDCPP
jgi:hypothetical protein